MKFWPRMLLTVLLLTACSPGVTPELHLIPSVAPTLTSIPLPTATITPVPTIDPNTLPTSCLDTTIAGDIVEGWLHQKNYATLRDAWQAFMEETGEGEILTSSTTDYNDELAYAVTWRKMLLVGEYPFQIHLNDRQGIGHCSILVYPGGTGPEVGLGITDATLGGEWSGYASGLVGSEGDTRAYLASRVGKAVTVRYMVAQNPQDGGFVRLGFFSPVMQRLWDGSYYTRIPNEMNLLTDMVGQPRGPSIFEMMVVAGSLKGYGVFLEYVVDSI